MCEEAAIYRLDAAEAQAKGRVLEELVNGSVRELEVLRGRVRELEDAILLHRSRSARWKMTGSAHDDEELWAKVDAPWT